MLAAECLECRLRNGHFGRGLWPSLHVAVVRFKPGQLPCFLFRRRLCLSKSFEAYIVKLKEYVLLLLLNLQQVFSRPPPLL